MDDNTLCKAERLRGERVISNLFDSGRSFFESPFKIFWIKIDEKSSFSSRFAVAVPKKRFKSAVKRNLLKRRTREAFRINKKILNEAINDDKQVHLIVIYSSDIIQPYSEIEAAMKKILQRIAQKLKYAHSKEDGC